MGGVPRAHPRAAVQLAWPRVPSQGAILIEAMSGHPPGGSVVGALEIVPTVGPPPQDQQRLSRFPGSETMASAGTKQAPSERPLDERTPTPS